MNAFWSLVRNDTKFGTNLKYQKFKWFWLYFAAAAIIALIQYTYFIMGALRLSFDPVYVVPIFIFVFILASMKPINIEWRADTEGWWLSLPYSRKMLLGVKMFSSFILYLKGIAAVTIMTLVLFLEAYILRPDLFLGNALTVFLGEVVQSIVLLVIFSPFPIVFGTLLALVRNSKWRPAVPLFWICIPFGLSLLMSKMFNGYEDSPFRYKINLLLNSGTHTLLALVVLEIAAVVLFGILSLYILETQIEA